MAKPLHKQPLVAVCLAVGAAVVAHQANANAAQVLGVSIATLSSLIAVMGFLASQG